MPECSPAARRLRIALVHYRDSAGSGGSLRVGEAVANHLDRRTLDPHVVFAYGGPGPVAASGRVRCHYLDARGPGDPLAWLRARSLMRTLDPAVIHYMDAVFWLRAALLGLGAPSLVHMHGPVVESALTRRQRWLWRALGRISSGHVCVSQAMREAALRHGWSDAERTWVVYNGIDTRRFAQLPVRGDARARFGLPESAFVFGMLCRLTAGKGCREAVDLVALLPPRCHLLLCGEGPLRDALEDAARQAGAGNRVHLAGKVDDPREAYAAMDALLFLSRYETFGLVIAEAMAAGVPVIGLAGDGGYRELPVPLVTPSNSFLIEQPRPADFFAPETPETIACLAGHILRVTSQRELLEERAAIARAWVREHFEIGRQAVALEQIYREIALPGGAAA
ncbi:MAG TPA: glycosyltransferase [Bryobacteraceae bacterium]|nr:glycosyltransferase [Bryobacteraceae bacterium]